MRSAIDWMDRRDWMPMVAFWAGLAYYAIEALL